MAIAYCGAKPIGLLGAILYKAATTTIKINATITDFEIFIYKGLENKNKFKILRDKRFICTHFTICGNVVRFSTQHRDCVTRS